MNIPEKGFYYHYKHTDSSFDSYAYEVIAIGQHTENREQKFVIYWPLYKEAEVWKLGGLCDVRPLEMFMENVTKDGKTFPRFKKIEDPTILAKLKSVSREMYPDLQS